MCVCVYVCEYACVSVCVRVCVCEGVGDRRERRERGNIRIVADPQTRVNTHTFPDTLSPAEHSD